MFTQLLLEVTFTQPLASISLKVLCNYRTTDPAEVMSYSAPAFYKWANGALRLNKLTQDK